MDHVAPVGSAFIRQLRDPTMPPKSAIVGLFRLRCAGGPRPVEERLPSFDPDTDLIAYELPDGDADIAIFHADGSATAIVVKDGANGLQHALQGIEQSRFAASRLAMKCCAGNVRRALLWTSAGDAMQDVIVELACESAGVIALPWAPLARNLAALDPEGMR